MVGVLDRRGTRRQLTYPSKAFFHRLRRLSNNRVRVECRKPPGQMRRCAHAPTKRTHKSFKNLSRTVRDVPATQPNELKDLNLAAWLGGRDSSAFALRAAARSHWSWIRAEDGARERAGRSLEPGRAVKRPSKICEGTWLGGRDSNPDTVVQRLGERQHPARSGHSLRALRAERTLSRVARSRIPTNCHMAV